MKLAPTYLTQNRHGTFYFRMVIPVSLRSLVNGIHSERRQHSPVKLKLLTSEHIDAHHGIRLGVIN